MTISGILVSAGTAITNPDPNSLTRKNPYPDVYANRDTIDPLWIEQGILALFPLKDYDVNLTKPIQICFVPSDGEAVTYRASMWQWIKEANIWVPPFDTPYLDLTGNGFTYIERPGRDPIAIQLSNISSGNIDVYFDASLARAQ